MAGTATTEDLIALQQKQHQELTGTLDNITKNVKQLFKDVAGIVKNEGDSITDSLKKFESNQKKQREKNNQLRIIELQDLHKKMKGVEQDIRKARGGELEISLKLQQDYNKKIKQLELFEMGYRLQKNKEFYKEINKAFKEFSDRTTKVAGKLDSVFSTTFFGSITKATNSIAGIGKNLLNFGLGTMKFLQTVTSKERGGGLKMALAQTKIGRGVRDVKRSFRQTKIGIGKGIKAIKSNIGGASGRMSARAKTAEMQEAQASGLAVNKKGVKASEGMFSSFTAFFKWFKSWEMMKFAWQVLKTGANAIASVLGLIMPKLLLKPLAGLLVKSRLGRKALRSGIGRKVFKKVFPKRAAGTALKRAPGGAAAKGVAGKVAKRGAVGILKKVGTGVAKKLPLVGWAIAAFEGIQGGIKGWKESKGKSLATRIRDTATSAAGNIVESFSFGLISRKTVQKGLNVIGKGIGGIGNILFSPFKGLFGIFKKRGNELSKETQEDITKKTKKDKTPQIYAAEGFPKKTTQPKNLGELFGRIDRRTNVTVAEGGESEYLSVLKKDQYDQLRSMMAQQLSPSFLNPKSLAKGVSKAASATFKALGGAVKWLFGKKSDEEKKNQDEDMKKYGGEINKGAYKLKDQNVDIENLPFKNRLSAMLAERFKLTGKKTQINSGYRNIEDQMRVYREMPDRAAKPGLSPHGPPNPRAVDMNSSDVADLVELGLIKKYGFKYPSARTKSGAAETWHIQAKAGAAFANAPKDFMMKGHAGEGAFVAKTKEFESVFKYFEMGKQLAENVMTGKLGMNFSKDIPGRALRDTQKGPDAGENKLAQQTVKLLSEIKTVLAKDKMGKEEKGQKGEKSMGAMPSISGQGGSAGYKPKSEVFPTDILMTNMYAMMTQFSGGY